MKKLSLSTAILLMGIIVTSIAIASIHIERTVQHSLIISGSEDFQIYSDAACTTILSSIDWGELKHGDQQQKELWIKNIGDGGSITVYYQYQPSLPTGVLITLFDGSNYWDSGSGNSKVINKDQILYFTAKIQIDAAASAGTYSWDQMFTGDA